MKVRFVNGISLIYFLSLFFTISCSKKLVINSPISKIESMPIIPLSTISLPISVPIAEVDRLINTLVQSSLKEGFTVEDSYRMNAKIDGNISTSAYDQYLNFRIPVAVEIFPKSGWSQLKATGKIELELEVFMNIFQNIFLSKSNIKSYHWIVSPKLTFLGINLPVEKIATSFVEKYKVELCKNLDQYFNNSIDLDKLKSKIRKSFEDPFYTTEDGIIKVFTSPSEIALGPIKIEKDKIIFPALIYIENVIATEKPKELYNDLSFSFRPQVDEISKFAIQSRIPLNYLEIIVKENFENQSFGSGITKLKINKMNLLGSEKSVYITLQTSGAYKGTIQVKFDPAFNESKKEIVLENFQMKALEGKKMDKTLFALVKGIAENKVKKEIENGLNNLLKEYKMSLLPYLQNKEIYPGVIMIGDLKEWEIKDFNFVNQILCFNVNTSIISKLEVYKINSNLLYGY